MANHSPNSNSAPTVQLWVVFGLAISATCVSGIGAWFSIVGLGKLFTGAVLSVWFMAASLEVAKFTVAAFLHQVWPRLNILFKSYLILSVMTLSGITSLGIFGFLSDAYQESSTVLETETLKLESLKSNLQRIDQDMERVNRNVEEIPDARISKKMKARAEAEILIMGMRQKQETLSNSIADANLKVLSVKDKVGPLIYIARAFQQDIDTVVKYLIMAFVFVFDPLALCLVVALSMALKLRKEPGVVKMRFASDDETPQAESPPEPSLEPAKGEASQAPNGDTGETKQSTGGSGSEEAS